jgi:DNA polymerase III epsilon subunit-like protein
MRKDLAFVDTETTGLDSKKHTVIEICVDLCTPYPHLNTIKRLETKIQLSDYDLSMAEPKALEINGYTREKWKDARTDFADLWNEVKLMMHDAVPVGHFVDFDLFDRNKLDTKVFAIMFGHLHRTYKYNLKTAHELTKMPPRAAHTAGGDVDMCKDLYRTAMDYFVKGYELTRASG